MDKYLVSTKCAGDIVNHSGTEHDAQNRTLHIQKIDRESIIFIDLHNKLYQIRPKKASSCSKFEVTT